MKNLPHTNLLEERKAAKAADAQRAAGRFTNYTADATANITHEIFHRARQANTEHTRIIERYGKEDARKIAHAILNAAK